MKIKTTVLSVLVALGALTAVPAFAESDSDDYAEMVAQQNAKISSAQAQKIAIEAVGGGVVVDIDFDTSPRYQDGYYEVEVQNGKTKYDVKIDAGTGKVIKKKIDR